MDGDIIDMNGDDDEDKESTFSMLSPIRGSPHAELHPISPQVMTKFQCGYCTRSFDSLRGRNIHASKTHMEVRSQSSQLRAVDVDDHIPTPLYQSPITPIVTSSSMTNNVQPITINDEVTVVGPSQATQIQTASRSNSGNVCLICQKRLPTQKGLKLHTIQCMRKHDMTPNEPSQGQDDSNPVEALKKKLIDSKSKIRVLPRVPKAARFAVADKLCTVIKSCIQRNTLEAWSQLLLFSFIVLNVNNDRTKSLAMKIKDNVLSFTLPNLGQRKVSSPSLAKRVEAKVDDFDVKGAVRLLSSNDTLAPYNESTVQQLREKHPVQNLDLNFPEPPNETDLYLIVNEKDVQSAISSFPSGSSGGMDGFKPQFFKDVTSVSAGEAGKRVLSALTQLSNFMLSGQVNQDVCPFLYGASLYALSKKDNGVRPIAVGSVFRRLTAKLACRKVQLQLTDYFTPTQLGVGIKQGCETAIHGTRTYICHPNNSSKVLLKIDFANAFNTVSRDHILQQVKEKAPHIYPFLFQCYRNTSYLFFGNDIIPSETGCQQGDPCSPLLFSLSVQPIVESMTTELNVWYLDDATFADSSTTVFENFEKLIDLANNVGLKINYNKCELYLGENVLDQKSVIQTFLSKSPGIRVVDRSQLNLLGSPIFEEGFMTFTSSKIDNLKLMTSRLNDLNTHTSYLLLKNCFMIPKLTYLLRTSPFWKFKEMVNSIDDLLHDSLQSILNITLDNTQWNQATLPINYGGLGIRKVSDIVLPAFLSSAHGVSNLVSQVLHSLDQGTQIHLVDEAMYNWKQINGNNIPEELQFQKCWDTININRIIMRNQAENPIDAARFLALQEKESGAWLKAFPSKSIGTFMENRSFRTCIGLRLGCKIVKKHKCECGVVVEENGIHGLNCVKSKGRFSRHSELNDIIHRSLASIHIPSTLEPLGLSRDDGKRPDGMTLIPWCRGQSLVWDSTCVNTFAESYINNTRVTAGYAAEEAARRKNNKYMNIAQQNYIFTPLAYETMGPWSKGTKDIVKKIGQGLIQLTGNSRSLAFLVQRISIAIQRGNAASVLGTLPTCATMEEVFDV